MEIEKQDAEKLQASLDRLESSATTEQLALRENISTICRSKVILNYVPSMDWNLLVL